MMTYVVMFTTQFLVDVAFAPYIRIACTLLLLHNSGIIISICTNLFT